MGVLVSVESLAADPDRSENDCPDRGQWERIAALQRQYPKDALLNRTYALRIGICRLIDEGRLHLEDGIRLFGVERRRAIMERLEEGAARKRPKPLPDQDIEPVGGGPEAIIRLEFEHAYHSEQRLEATPSQDFKCLQVPAGDFKVRKNLLATGS
jgi:hypothetical protein